MSTTVTRQIVRVDPELCNGCGACVSPCAEGAITIVDGKPTSSTRSCAMAPASAWACARPAHW